MQPNCDIYRRRLMRLKTLGVDSKFAHAAMQLQSIRVESSVGVGASVAPPREKISTNRNSSSGSKYDSSSLWMRQPHRKRRPQQQKSQPVVADLESLTCQDRQSTLMDMQTNNSKKSTRCGEFGSRGGVTTSVNNANNIEQTSEMEDCDQRTEDSEPELLQNSNTAGNSDDVANENAVAKGANALVKQATSRQTEIIDTSKLLEEGKVETQYEEPEDEPEEIEETDYALIDEYEKTFAYARRLRALLNMKFKIMDRNSIETNFLLVKAHEHPTQRSIDRWRNVDLGDPYDSQIRQKKLVDDFKLTCGQKKKPKKGEVRIPVYPEWIKFYVRFKKEASEKRWDDFSAYKQKMKKLSGGKVAVPKANDRYLPAFYDIWSTSIAVFAKPESIMLNMIDPVFAKLGLDARADFKFTIGCFIGDKRAGKAKVQGAPAVAEEVTMQTMCGELYKRNCCEIFVNDNRIDMYQTFPDFYNPGGAADRGDDQSTGKKDGKKDKKGKKGGKNQSNLDSASELADQQSSELLRKKPQASSISDGTESRQQGDNEASVVKASLSLADEVAEFDSSPSATNQNLSIHDCDSSDESQQTIEDDGNTTTKSGRTETTRRE